jgi:hypothetical protein
MIKFLGNFRVLQQRVKNCQVRGVWRYITANDLHQFKAETGENLNWWPTTGTITFQGGDVSVLQDRYALGYLPGELHRTARGHSKTILRRR